jgi:hypothetical protein
MIQAKQSLTRGRRKNSVLYATGNARGQEGRGPAAQKVYVPKDISDAEEFIDLREAFYERLCKHSIPPNLIWAVLELRGNAAVRWVTKSGCPAQPGDNVAAPVVNYESRKGTLNDTDDLLEINLSQPIPETADEALAMCLRERLSELRLSGPNSAPVRRRKMLSRGDIARIATDMLKYCRVCKRPPGLHLEDLFFELFEVDRPKITDPVNFLARSQAAWILSQAPNTGPRAIAKMIGVDASSVLRWKKSDAFRKQIEICKRRLKSKYRVPCPPCDMHPIGKSIK